MIEIRELTKKFGSRTILEGISFTVESGEILAIMGSSGGGKTTLLKCLCGLTPITSGAVEVDGVDVAKNAELAREKMGLVFQSSALFDSLSVADNVLFGLRRHRNLKSGEEREVLDELLESIGLSEARDKLPAELSGGMRKRVGLARALAMEPAVLLYDEPTTGLDPVTAYTIDRLIVDTRAERGVTSLVVSHDLGSVHRVADRVAFLEAGMLTFLGTPDEFALAKNAAIQELVAKATAKDFSFAE